MNLLLLIAAVAIRTSTAKDTLFDRLWANQHDPWSICSSVDIRSINHLINFIPLMNALFITNQTFMLDMIQTTMFGTLVMDKIYVKDIHGFDDRTIQIGPNDDQIQINIRNINLDVFLYGSFELFDMVHISFDDTHIKVG